MASHTNHSRSIAISTIACLTTVWLGTSQAHATTLYATSVSGSRVDQADTATLVDTTYLNTPTAPDSIIFDGSGNLIYSALYTGQVIRYDPNTTLSTTLGVGMSTPADMVLEPGGNSMLVSEFNGGKVDRINLNTLAFSTVSTGLGNPEGLAYDGSKLFVNMGNRAGGPTGKEVAQIDPVTGAILATSPGLNSLDGLTYDPYSGLLYACSLFGNAVYSIDPNNLNNVHDVTSALGPLNSPDGITTDAVGNIWIADSGDQYIYQLNLINNTLTRNTFVSGLDDLAPASGAGSVPEPSGLGLLALAAMAVGARRRRCGPAPARIQGSAAP
jgi:sugar lactone lactonase YvrE